MMFTKEQLEEWASEYENGISWGESHDHLVATGERMIAHLIKTVVNLAVLATKEDWENLAKWAKGEIVPWEAYER